MQNKLDRQSPFIQLDEKIFALTTEELNELTQDKYSGGYSLTRIDTTEAHFPQSFCMEFKGLNVKFIFMSSKNINESIGFSHSYIIANEQKIMLTMKENSANQQILTALNSLFEKDLYKAKQVLTHNKNIELQKQETAEQALANQILEKIHNLEKDNTITLKTKTLWDNISILNPK